MFSSGCFDLRNQPGGQEEWPGNHAPTELACAPATERNLEKSLNMRTVRSRSQANKQAELPEVYGLKGASPSQEGVEELGLRAKSKGQRTYISLVIDSEQPVVLLLLCWKVPSSSVADEFLH